MEPANLYEQMTDGGKEALATLLGFSVGLGERSCSGFRLNLQEIPPLAVKKFTLGAAKRAYLKHLMRKA